jgi:hypothetical protein
MRGLIALREQHRSFEFEVDYEEVQRILRVEQERKQPPVPPPPPKPAPIWRVPEQPQEANSETALTRAAFAALDSFMAVLQPTEEGSPTLGAMFTTFTFDCFGSRELRAAVQCMVRAIPSGARLSKWIMPVPPGMTGAVVNNEYVAVRALKAGSALETRLDITWDPA